MFKNTGTYGTGSSLTPIKSKYLDTATYRYRYCTGISFGICMPIECTGTVLYARTCPPDLPRPYCRPSTKPASQSVLMIRSSILKQTKKVGKYLPMNNAVG